MKKRELAAYIAGITMFLLLITSVCAVAYCPPAPRGFSAAGTYRQIWGWHLRAQERDAALQELQQLCAAQGAAAAEVDVYCQNGAWNGAIYLPQTEVSPLWLFYPASSGVGLRWYAPQHTDRLARRSLLQNMLQGWNMAIEYEDDTICIAGCSRLGVRWQVACAQLGAGTVYYVASPAWQGDLS